MNVVMTAAALVIAFLAVACSPIRGQSDRVDNKYLDPNDYFLAGGDQQDRRRVQDAYNRCVKPTMFLRATSVFKTIFS